jgi:serine/threonine protein kinase
VSGGELFQKIVDEDNLNEADAARYIIQVLQGVRHMHRKNIVHLDLKVCRAESGCYTKRFSTIIRNATRLNELLNQSNLVQFHLHCESSLKIISRVTSA